MMSPAIDSSPCKVSDQAIFKLPSVCRNSPETPGNFRCDSSASRMSGSVKYQLSHGARLETEASRSQGRQSRIHLSGVNYLKNLPSILAHRRDSMGKDADLSNRPAFPEGASVSLPTSTTTLEYLLHGHGTNSDTGDLRQSVNSEESTKTLVSDEDAKTKASSVTGSSYLSRRSSVAENSDLAAQQFLRSEPCLYSHRIFLRAAKVFEFLMEDVKKQTGDNVTEDHCLDSEDIGAISFDNIQEQIKTLELAFSALKFQTLFSEALDQANFFTEFSHLLKDYGLVCVMLYDLQSRRFQKRTPFPEEQLNELCNDIESALISKQTRLQSHIAKERIKRNAPSIEYLLPEDIRHTNNVKTQIPVYFWVNQMKTTLEKAVAELEADGFTKMATTDDVTQHTGKVFKLDTHCSDLLVFPAHFDQYFKDTKWYKMGHLVPQDKTSCLAPQSVQYLLGTDKDVIHVNIGTGMTTGHLASLLRKKSPNSHIWAFGVESVEKAKTAVKNIEFLGAKNIKILMDDFLSVDPEEPKLRSVKVIMITANCSKSAITSPVHFIIREGEDMRILSDLCKASMDLSCSTSLTLEHERVLRHALKFPRVQAVVYATRSRYEAENESVVTRALEFTKVTANSRLIPFKVTPPVLPFTVEEINSGTSGIYGRYVRFLPCEKSNGCFIAVISREPEDFRDSTKTIVTRARSKGLLGKTKSVPLSLEEESLYDHDLDATGKELRQSKSGGRKLKGATSAPEVKTGISSKLAGHKSPAAVGARLYQAGLVHKMEQRAKLKIYKPEHQK